MPTAVELQGTHLCDGSVRILYQGNLQQVQSFLTGKVGLGSVDRALLIHQRLGAITAPGARVVGTAGQAGAAEAGEIGALIGLLRKFMSRSGKVFVGGLNFTPAQMATFSQLAGVPAQLHQTIG